VIADAEWSWPRLTFQRVLDRREPPSPLHLDVTPADRAEGVAWLVTLGAVEGDTHTDAGFSWTVMHDPDGNEFCVTDP
jgi:hypothetical protein